MEAFLSNTAAAAAAGAPVDFTPLDTALSLTKTSDAAMELFSALMDALGADSCAAHRGIILQGLCRALQTLGPRCPLPLEDHLVLAMFFNELATGVHEDGFLHYASAVSAFYPIAVRAAYGSGGDAGATPHTGIGSCADDVVEAVASVRAELRVLREGVASRLGSTPVRDSQLPARAALDCLATMMRGQLRVLSARSDSENANTSAATEAAAEAVALATEVAGSGEGILRVLLAAVGDPQATATQRAAASGSSSALGRGGGKTNTSRSTPASLVASALAYVEELLWGLSRLASSPKADEKDMNKVEEPSTDEGSAYSVAATGAFRQTVSTLLGHLQRYLALQQQRQSDRTMSPSSTGGATGSLIGSVGDGPVDVLRLYAAQRAVQRALSVAAAAEESHRRRLTSATLRSGVSAALAAFGGALSVEPPVPVASATVSPVGEWTGVGGGRLRLCSGALAAAEGGEDALHAGGAAFPDEASLYDPDGAYENDYEGEDGDLDGDEEVTAMRLRAGRVPLLNSSLGPLTAAALADIVVASVAALDRALAVAADLRAVHLQGLTEMQTAAAHRAQRAELRQQRALERQGVEAIPAAKLLDHVRDSATLRARGVATLRRPTARAVLERAAFSSVLRAYASMRGESEASVRAAQALVSRCLLQMAPGMADAALDEVLAHLRTELRRERRLRESNGGTPPPTGWPVTREHSYYQLALQIVFAFAAARAPMEERAGLGGALLGGRDGLVTAASAAASITARAVFGIDTENPIAFLLEENPDTPSYQPTGEAAAAARKRARRETTGAAGGGARREDTRDPNQVGGNGSDDGEDDDDFDGDYDGSGGNGSGGGAAVDGDGGFAFRNDTARHPCAYSHLLCRLLELADSCRLDTVLLDLLLQAPLLTRYVWGYLYRRFCLSTTSRERCVTGFRLLSGIAARRTVYRSCAVNLLLQLCVSSNHYARRVSIVCVGALLSQAGRDGRPVVPPDVEAALVRYAKRQLAAVPGYQFTVVRRTALESSANGAGGAAMLDEAAIAALQAAEDARANEVLGRHLGLFLKLCARQPRNLFSSLLDVYVQCVERDNEVMVRLLPANKDAQDMTKLLLESDPEGFMFAVVPYLRRHSEDACLFVQTLLWTISEHLAHLCRKAGVAAAAGENEAANTRAVERYRTVAAGMLEHARAMYNRSHIPLGSSGRREGDGGVGGGDGAADNSGDGGGFVLHDIRFLAPFLGQLPTAEMKQQYLPAFLLFVQVQLQLQLFYRQQRQAHQPQGRSTSAHPSPASGSIAMWLLSPRERAYVLTHEELRAFIALVVRETLTRAPYAFTDGVARGLSPVDFFVYLHRAPQESVKAAAATGAPPVGVVTTKEVVGACLDLTQTFIYEPATAVPRLYGPEEVQRAVKRMMQPPPVPSQTMATVLTALAVMYPRGTRYATIKDLLVFVVNHVLTPLERARTWETDPQLWKGALLFAEKFYSECGGFMVNLPDQVLIEALREHPRLAEMFREEHGNNASFGHILGNI